MTLGVGSSVLPGCIPHVALCHQSSIAMTQEKLLRPLIRCRLYRLLLQAMVIILPFVAEAGKAGRDRPEEESCRVVPAPDKIPVRGNGFMFSNGTELSPDSLEVPWMKTMREIPSSPTDSPSRTGDADADADAGTECWICMSGSEIF